MSVTGPLFAEYDARLIGLAAAVGIFTAYAALDIAGRVTNCVGRARKGWLAGGSVATGIGVGAMQLLWLAAIRWQGPVQFEWPGLLAAVLAATLAAGIGFIVVSRAEFHLFALLTASFLMGGCLTVMQYEGATALRLPGLGAYPQQMLTHAFAPATAISWAALLLAYRFRGKTVVWGWAKAGGGLLLAAGLLAAYRIAISDVHLLPDGPGLRSVAHTITLSRWDIFGAAAAVMLLLMHVLIGAAISRRKALSAGLLEENRLQLQTVFDHMRESVIVVDYLHGSLLYNRAARELLSIERSTLSLGEVEEIFEAFSPAGDPIPWEEGAIAQARHGHFTHDEEVVIRNTKTGVVVTALVSATPISGTPRRKSHQVVFSMRDISAQKRAEELQTRLASIVESSDDAIIGKNEHGIVTSWNQGAERIFGYTAEEMIGQSMVKLMPSGDAEEEDRILERIKKGETVNHIESMRKRKDGAVIHVSLTISPIRDAHGNVVGASKIARDMTEKKLLERQLRQGQKMEAIGQLTGGIAHDFNNLMGVVLGNLELLERLVEGNEPALKRVRIAQEGLARGAEVTRRLLTFSSVDDLRPTVIGLNDAVENMIALATRAIGPEITVRTNFQNNLPAALVDRAGLESALLNLVVNARDAMSGAGTINISTQLHQLEESYPAVQTGELQPGQYACVAISDSGHGMSRETLDRAFEPFFTTKPRGKGTGLGLAMVYGFVKQSGGAVRIYSELNYGTTVTLYLPLAGNTARAAEEIASSAAPITHGGTVLVVDDEPELLDIAFAFLAEMGYIALQASNGAKALEVVERHPEIDLLLTDIVMPGGMNGVELAQRIQRILPAIKVIYSSGFPTGALAERNLPLVDGPLLHKPYRRAEFGNMVRSAMEPESKSGAEGGASSQDTQNDHGKS